MRTAYQNGSNRWVSDLWSLETPDNRYPTLTNIADISNYNYQCSSWLVNDGSYHLRLKNITIGYSCLRACSTSRKFSAPYASPSQAQTSGKAATSTTDGTPRQHRP